MVNRHWIKYGALFGALLLGCITVAQAQGKAFATLKPEVVETGDTFQLTVIVSAVSTQPKDIDFASWVNVFPSTNILSRSDWRRSGAQWIRQFTLIAFDSAALELPPLTVMVAVGQPLVTNPLSLKVFPTRGSGLDEMAPIRELYREPVSWLDYWPWGAGFLALLALVWMFLRRIRPRPQPVPPPVVLAPPPVSASETALKKLRELEAQQLWKNDQVKEHYAAVSLIVREYLEQHFNIGALESTTIEILAMIPKVPFPDELRPALKDLLSKTDLVKYAQSHLEEKAHAAIIQQARELVAPVQSNASTPAPAPPAKKPSSGRYEPL